MNNCCTCNYNNALLIVQFRDSPSSLYVCLSVRHDVDTIQQVHRQTYEITDKRNKTQSNSIFLVNSIFKTCVTFSYFFINLLKSNRFSSSRTHFFFLEELTLLNYNEIFNHLKSKFLTFDIQLLNVRSEISYLHILLCVN